MRHHIPIQIRFNDIDLFGHLNNSVYVQFFDMGKLAYFKQFMEGGFEHEPSVPVVAKIECTFLAPVHIDDRIEVRTAIVSIGESSLVLEQEIVDAAGTVKSKATTVMVNVNAHTATPEPVSRAWRDAIGAYEGREF